MSRKFSHFPPRGWLASCPTFVSINLILILACLCLKCSSKLVTRCTGFLETFAVRNAQQKIFGESRARERERVRESQALERLSTGTDCSRRRLFGERPGA